MPDDKARPPREEFKNKHERDGYFISSARDTFNLIILF